MLSKARWASYIGKCVCPEDGESTEIQSLIGLNSNLTVGDKVLHVQTEDLGRRRACIVTHVFSKSGQVVHKVRFDYSKHLAHPNLVHILPRAMQTQHVSVMQRLREEGVVSSVSISQTDLPCVRVEEKTPPPELVGSAPRKPRACLPSGVWDRLVEQAKADRERELAAAVPIALPEDTPGPGIPPLPTEKAERGAHGHSWEAAIARAHREYETPPADPSPPERMEGGDGARHAYEMAMACLHREETEPALVWLCQAVGLEPGNSVFRGRLRRLLIRMGSD
jgi:hypothetical protein